ncbi:MAG: universal stress protein [Kineosporiaceae bacterium]
MTGSAFADERPAWPAVSATGPWQVPGRGDPVDATPAVLVGLDGSLGGERALEWALHEAVALASPVRAVTAWAWDARLLTDVGSRPSQRAEQLRRQQEDQIARVLGRTGPTPCRIETHVVEGDPASLLLTLSRAARLLVIGSHGEPGRPAVGSVARACLRFAVCPVVVVPVDPPA